MPVEEGPNDPIWMSGFLAHPTHRDYPLANTEEEKRYLRGWWAAQHQSEKLPGELDWELGDD